MEAKPVPMGVVTGPFNATLLRMMESRTSCGSGSPERVSASAPTKYFSHSTSTPAHSMICTTAAVTSGPMPSPGSRVILCLAMRKLLGRRVQIPCALTGALQVEREREHIAKRLIHGQFFEAAGDALQRRRDEVEVVHASAG